MTGLLDLSEGIAWFDLFPAIHFLSQLLLLSGSQGCQGVSPGCLGAKLGWAPHQWPVHCKATKSDKQPFTLKLLQTVRSYHLVSLNWGTREPGGNLCHTLKGPGRESNPKTFLLWVQTTAVLGWSLTPAVLRIGGRITGIQRGFGKTHRWGELMGSSSCL